MVRLISALIELASNSQWSDAVASVGFLAFLAWVFAASVILVVAMERSSSSPESSDRDALPDSLNKPRVSTLGEA